jgi:hypothetical protein
MEGVHVLRGQKASLRWLSNRDLRTRRRSVRVLVHNDRLIALGQGRRWWRHFLRPGRAELHVGDRTFTVWPRLDHKPTRSLIRRPQVVLVLDSPEGEMSTGVPSGPDVVDLRHVVDLRDAPVPPATPSAPAAEEATTEASVPARTSSRQAGNPAPTQKRTSSGKPPAARATPLPSRKVAERQSVATPSALAE